MNDPLLDFLQNGRSIPNDAVPVNYRVQPRQASQQPVSNFLNMLNPMNWLKSLIQDDPRVQQVIDLIEQNGGDAKAAFLNECKNRNEDPEHILRQVKANPLFKQFMK